MDTEDLFKGLSALRDDGDNMLRCGEYAVFKNSIIHIFGIVNPTQGNISPYFIGRLSPLKISSH